MKKLWTFVNIILGIGYGIFLGIMVINAIIFNETLTIEKKLLFPYINTYNVLFE